MQWLIDLLQGLFARRAKPADVSPPIEAAPAVSVDACPLTQAQVERAVVAAGAQIHRVDVAGIATELRAASVRYGLRDVLPIAHLIPQVAHESNGFVYTREIWRDTPAQQRYEGNKNLGNTQPGDGRRFAGLFWLQLTGRWNHTAYAKFRGIELEELPALADDLYTNADVAHWYIVINRPGFLQAARRNDVLGVSVAVNGRNASGLPNGWEDRQKRTAAVMQTLGITQP